MRETPFSRYPVYRGGDSEVMGILEVKNLLDQLELSEPDLFRTLREPLFVSESTHALKLLEILREEQQSLAMVVDEYGDIQGLVTISDVMGSVLGRLLAGESADSDPLVFTREDGSLLVDGGLRIDEFRELTGERLPDTEEHDYYTAAGMVIAHYGRIPHVGEHFQLGEWRIEVVDLDGPRVDKLLLQRMSQPLASALGDA
jgi:putative hemolysin